MNAHEAWETINSALLGAVLLMVVLSIAGSLLCLLAGLREWDWSVPDIAPEPFALERWREAEAPVPHLVSFDFANPTRTVATRWDDERGCYVMLEDA